MRYCKAQCNEMNASKFRVVCTRVLSLLGSSYGFILSCFRYEEEEAVPVHSHGLIAGPEPHPPPTHSPNGLQVARHCKERTWKNVFPFHFIYSETVVLACSALPLPPSLPRAPYTLISDILSFRLFVRWKYRWPRHRHRDAHAGGHHATYRIRKTVLVS